ncbi:NAD-dependent epimerase/dehydratase family protein [Thiobacter aerophilum]|uniref:NAD-dependent epimerase/dehydratase family protein n=1 Tax=Thiobacter aerophilum TaxID=3121275 RepID=A0ABV0ECN1_9BURK
MKALITGATGFIGRRLMREGDRALVRSPHPRPLSQRERGVPSPPTPLPVREGSALTPNPSPTGRGEVVVGDLLDPASLARACEGIETVFHCAGLADADTRDEALLWRVNVEGTKNLLEAAGRAGVRRFVFFSSVKAMAEPGDECPDEDWPGEPATSYGRAKRAAEAAVFEAGTRWGMHLVSLRLAVVYGRGNRGNLWKMAQAVKKGWFPPLPETGNRRSLVHVDDVVAAARRVAEDPRANGRTYIVADPRPYSTREIYDAMRGALGLPPIQWAVPQGAIRLVGLMGRRGRALVDRLLGSACYSPARIEAELGFRAQIGLGDGLREMLG